MITSAQNDPVCISLRNALHYGTSDSDKLMKHFKEHLKSIDPVHRLRAFQDMYRQAVCLVDSIRIAGAMTVGHHNVRIKEI